MLPGVKGGDNYWAAQAAADVPDASEEVREEAKDLKMKKADAGAF